MEILAQLHWTTVDGTEREEPVTFQIDPEYGEHRITIGVTRYMLQGGNPAFLREVFGLQEAVDA